MYRKIRRIIPHSTGKCRWVGGNPSQHGAGGAHEVTLQFHNRIVCWCVSAVRCYLYTLTGRKYYEVYEPKRRIQTKQGLALTPNQSGSRPNVFIMMQYYLSLRQTHVILCTLKGLSKIARPTECLFSIFLAFFASVSYNSNFFLSASSSNCILIYFPEANSRIIFAYSLHSYKLTESLHISKCFAPYLELFRQKWNFRFKIVSPDHFESSSRLFSSGWCC